jgi:hypothetical protein
MIGGVKKMEKKKVSKANSFEGYSFKTWLVKNKDTLKYLLMGISAVIANISTQGLSSGWTWVLTFAVPLVIKLGVDAIDFFSTEVKI